MPRPLSGLARRVSNRLAAPYMLELGQRLGELNGKIDVLQISVEAANRDVNEARAAQLSKLEGLRDDLANARQVLRAVYEQDPAQRRRLYALRASEEYELAYTDPEPLVSFVIPTYTRFELLRDVSIPSILNQSYSNVEVIVAGDCSPEETERVILEFDDPRVRFHNRSVRGPYPDDPAVRWYMLGSPPFNDGLALARGRWIGMLGDDDSVRPNHTETLLRAAQEQRLEHCYGRYQVHYPSGEVLDLGLFPPQKGDFVLQSSLYHAGLRFFEMEPADHLHAEVNDWSLCRRMLSAGVRFGMVDEFVADRHESRYHAHSDWSDHGIPSIEM
jgi:hypothetical protein